MQTRIKTTFGGVTFSGFYMGEFGVKVPVSALKKMLGIGKLKIVNTMQHDDTCEDESKGEVKPEVILESIKENGTPRTCRVKDGVLLYSQHLNEMYNITEVKEDFITLNVKDIGMPLSIAMSQWIRENRPDATGAQMLDCVIMLFGKVYNLHKDVNKTLLSAQDIVSDLMVKLAERENEVKKTK